MSTSMVLALVLMTAAGVTLGLSRLLSRPELHAALDHPNHRSLHVSPKPRTGGLAILAGVLVAGLLYAALVPGSDVSIPRVLATSAAAVILVSLLDDLWRIPALVRILVHAGAAWYLLSEASLSVRVLDLPWGPYPLAGWAAGLLSGLLLVWFTNLYNFMDGIDGLAAGMGVFGFGTYGVLGLLAQAPLFTAVAFIIAGACLGFLGVNYPPARIFMGDVGSSMLGFLAAGLALWADREGIFPLWTGILIFSPFVVDATVTLCRRLYNREAVWRAHRSHFYQRLVLLGWNHRRTSLSAYGLMAACGLSAVAAGSASSTIRIGIIMAWTLLYALIMIGITRMEQAPGNARDTGETDTSS